MKTTRILVIALLFLVLLFIPNIVNAATYGDWSYELTDNNSKIKLISYNGTATNVSIPNTIVGKPVAKLETNLFKNNCEKIKTVNIPTNVEEMGLSVAGFETFKGCNLTKVTFASDCKIKEISGFANMTNLTSINIPNNVETICSSAFSGCKSLKNITIPNSVKKIGSSAFSETGITEITIPSNVEEIGMSISGFGAFERCDLHKVTFASNCKIKEISGFANMKNLTSINIPNNVETICSSAFSGCTSLKSITIPNSVKKIETSAFSGCTNLEEILIPRSVTEIGTSYWSAFSGCNFNKLTIYCYSTGTAIEYAKENKIKYKRIDNIEDYTISGIEDKMYTGKPITLNISLKQRNVTLRAGTDYTISYANNTNVGTATVTLIGRGSYAGTVKKQFSIVKYTLGDINNDKKIDTKDARLALLAYVGKTKLDANQIKAADVNKDGKVDTKDARQILLYYVGKIKNF